MNLLGLLRARFRDALSPLTDDPQPLVEMVRPAQDPRFGDYQANCAMSLGNQLGQPPRDVAARIVAELRVDDLCQPPEIAGPGFINLKLRDDWLQQQLSASLVDDRLAVAATTDPRKFVIDYSSPNVAKPMHVGHIRSTVIGDALCRILRFLGHQVISDNHLGDWGTQFGMIIYGYKHFVDRQLFEQQPVAELGRLYKLVHRIVEYHQARGQTAGLIQTAQRTAQKLAAALSAERPTEKAAAKKADKEIRQLRNQLSEAEAESDANEQRIRAVEQDPTLAQLAQQHPQIGTAVLEETAKLHAGDPENLALWREFLPHCKKDIQRIYQRLNIRFDYEHGESFYHDQLGPVVQQLRNAGLATVSEGAVCVFLDGFGTPMIVQKQDGAYLYATSDLATIQYRMEHWQPDAMLYVVDHRQSEHFDKLFAAARRWQYPEVELQHISFGTVLGEDGRPYRTRSGDTVGLEGLLDEAIQRAHRIVSENDDAKDNGPELDAAQRQRVAEVVGIAAIKYADLTHNRTSDYVFSYDKMLAMEGNTATYMQYSYARTQSIFAKGDVDPQSLRQAGSQLAFHLEHPIERELALQLLRLEESLHDAVADYRPNQLTAYLFETANKFHRFYQQCDVLKAQSPELRSSRLMLCDLAGRTIRQGLDLLGIEVVDRM